MDVETISDELALLLSLMIMGAAFASKTVVWRPPIQSKPQKVTWFGRTFMFLAGSVGVLQFGIAILMRKHVLINPAWSAGTLQTSKFILEILFVAIVTPLLILSIRQLIRREDANKVNQLITAFLTVIWVYLLWSVIPGVAKQVSSAFHYLTS